VSEAANHLADAGISAAVIDARYVKPLDRGLLEEMALRCGRLVVVEDHTLVGGFGSAVLEELSERVPDAHVLRLGLPDRFVDHGDVADQHRAAGIDARSIAEATQVWLRRFPRGLNGNSYRERKPSVEATPALAAETGP
jgi:1-deoxy-D-xylulose-5-phosphate synthase